MKLQTKIPLKQQQEKLITYDSNIVSIGSCFSEHIGEKLNYFQFKGLQNPFGILFHPKAIEQLIEDAVSKNTYTKADVFQHNDYWHSFKAHSKLSAMRREDVINKLNTNLEETRTALKTATHVTLTLGTAWAYQLKENREFVANCHKVSQKKFTKTLLTVDVITVALQRIVTLIRSLNTSAAIIFTVSPVRHVKDGMVQNMQSKAHLLTAIHSTIQQNETIKGGKVNYFPAYEIMMDELRDYRFYKEDLIHPSTLAIHYIWEQFKLVWVSSNAQLVMDKVEHIKKRLAHKPLNANAKAHQLFLSVLEKDIEKAKQDYPFLSFNTTGIVSG